MLADLEELSQEGYIDLYYGDESHVCSKGYVPYGWQFPEEDISIPSERAYRINCLGFINRKSEYFGTMTEQNIGAEFVLEYLEKLSFKIQKETVLVLDNASVHRRKLLRNEFHFGKTGGCSSLFFHPIRHI